MDNPNPDDARKVKASIKKANGDIYMTFPVDRVEKIDFDGKETIHVWSSSFGKGKFDLKNWWGDCFSNLKKSVRFNEEKNILIINFGNGSYNRRERRSNWRWKHDVLVRHGLLVYSEEHHAWIQNKNLG
jgi:hypothetical protein